MSTTQQPGCLGSVFAFFRRRVPRNEPAGGQGQVETLPYRRKDFLLSKAERSFFGVLQQAVGGEYLLFPKIRIADLLWMPRGTESYQKHFNRISAKHIDFVLCDRNTVRPELAIELDDSSHQREKGVKRDAFVDGALRAAGLPLLRVPAKHAYGVEELRAQIKSALAGAR